MRQAGLAEQTFEGMLSIAGQEHFYFETQAAIAVPEERGGLTVYSSTQHPSEVQAAVAEVCGLPFHRVTCICRRMGGGFGGKETQAAHVAAMAAVLILLAAAAISALTGDVPSLVIISAMVLFSVLLDSVQEYRAEQAAEQLKVSVALKEQALRDGGEITIRADQLVPGDVVLLAAGDLVPADGRVLEARDFFVNEGLLTGESYPTEKRASAEGIVNVDVAQATNAAFMGTSVVSGSAKLLLCATGNATQLGEISSTLRHTPPPDPHGCSAGFQPASP